MPPSAVDLALTLRAIFNGFIADIDQRILTGEAPVGLASHDYIEGMRTLLETAENISGLSSLPQAVIDELVKQYQRPARE